MKLTNEICISFLRGSGWLYNHDKEITISERNKAIDDFASKLIMHFADWKLSNAPFNDDETDRIREIICETIENAIGGVEEIAEQLKVGVNNGTDNQ